MVNARSQVVQTCFFRWLGGAGAIDVPVGNGAFVEPEVELEAEGGSGPVGDEFPFVRARADSTPFISVLTCFFDVSLPFFNFLPPSIPSKRVSDWACTWGL